MSPLHPTPQSLSFPLHAPGIDHSKASARRRGDGVPIATAPRAKPGLNRLKPPRIRLVRSKAP
jgi:hypothetical protein